MWPPPNSKKSRPQAKSLHQCFLKVMATAKRNQKHRATLLIPTGMDSKFGPGKATTAQVRALFALTRKANYQEEDIQSLINPFNVSRFEDLPREAASQLIGYLQTEAAA